MRSIPGALMALLLALAPPALAATAWGQPVPAAELRIGALHAEADRLSSLHVEDVAAGSSFEVLFDATSERAAREAIPVLAAYYRQLASLLALEPSSIRWSAVLFARNADALVLERRADRVVWRVDVGADGQPSEAGRAMLVRTLPHEQVHATQKTPGHDGPRWFDEGQAEWAGLQVVAAWDPAAEAAMRAELGDALAKTGPSVALARWGGIQPRPEAILRQLTPAQREQFLKDPSSVPGPFTFRQGDLVSDESNTQARYAASLALFEALEQRAGRDALQGWFRTVRAAGEADGNEIARLAQAATGVDVADALR